MTSSNISVRSCKLHSCIGNACPSRGCPQTSLSFRLHSLLGSHWPKSPLGQDFFQNTQGCLFLPKATPVTIPGIPLTLHQRERSGKWLAGGYELLPTFSLEIHVNHCIPKFPIFWALTEALYVVPVKLPLTVYLSLEVAPIPNYNAK